MKIICAEILEPLKSMDILPSTAIAAGFRPLCLWTVFESEC